VDDGTQAGRSPEAARGGVTVRERAVLCRRPVRCSLSAGGWPGRRETIAACLLALLLAADIARAESPVLSVQARRGLLPLVVEESLDAGHLDADDARGVSTVVIEVTAPEDSAGWVLYIRAEQPVFSGEGAGKPCTDLEWKLDQATAADYRPLDDHETVVVANPAGGSARIALDVRMGVDWRSHPGTYGLGLVLRVAAN
jgi:hypothetical protein